MKERNKMKWWRFNSLKEYTPTRTVMTPGTTPSLSWSQDAYAKIQEILGVATSAS